MRSSTHVTRWLALIATTALVAIGCGTPPAAATCPSSVPADRTPCSSPGLTCYYNDPSYPAGCQRRSDCVGSPSEWAHFDTVCRLDAGGDAGTNS